MVTKFFKEFAGNKAAFVKAGHETTYANNIVLIKDESNNGAGACIYARGSYFGNFAELIAALTYIKNVKVGENTYSREGGATLEFASGANSQVVLDVQNGKVTISLTPTFVQSVNDVIAEVATIKGDYLTSADRTAIEGLIATAKSEAIAEVRGNASTDTKDSKTIEGVIKLVNEKTSGIASEGVVNDLSNRVQTIEGDYLKTADKNDLAGRIKANTDAIAVLNGNSTTDGSVDKKVSDAINAFASAATDNGTIDTFKELVEYVASHGTEFSELVGEVDENTKDIATLNGDVNVAGSVDKKIADAIEDLASDGELAAVSADVATLKGQMGEGTVDDRISAAKSQADTAAQGYANEALDSAKSYADGLAGNYATAAQGTKADNAAPADTVYTKAEIEAMFAWETIA